MLGDVSSTPRCSRRAHGLVNSGRSVCASLATRSITSTHCIRRSWAIGGSHFVRPSGGFRHSPESIVFLAHCRSSSRPAPRLGAVSVTSTSSMKTLQDWPRREAPSMPDWLISTLCTLMSYSLCIIAASPRRGSPRLSLPRCGQPCQFRHTRLSMHLNATYRPCPLCL